MTSTIVVTGANGDIGRVVVDQALTQGRRVIATIRDKEQINNFPSHDSLDIVVMDVADKSSVDAAFNEIDGHCNGQCPDAIIHCAAVIRPSTIEYVSSETLEEVLRINTVGSLNIMQAAFPRLRDTGKNLVLCSSFWGRVSGPMVGPYASSKWALEALADAARRETKGMGFSITLANIGAVRGTGMLVGHKEKVTQFLNETPDGLYSHIYETQLESLEKSDPVFSDVDKVAAKLLRIADKEKPAPRYKVGKDAALICFLSWLLPASWLDKAL